MRKSITLFFCIAFIGLTFSQTTIVEKLKSPIQKPVEHKDSLKVVVKDTLHKEVVKTKLYKKDVRASYYHDKFNGRKTASGTKFDNNKYTAAHRKFPFGTKLKVTNQASGRSIVVEVTDRGPFSRGREIDLTQRGFMEIAKNKGIGVMVVTIEEIIK